MKIAILVPSIALTFLTACAAAPPPVPVTPVPMTPEIQTAAQQGVKGSLRDPDSAQFGGYMRAFQRDPTSWMVCGTVNAKNGFGGYTGLGPFFVVVLSAKKSDGTAVYVGSNAVLAGPADLTVFYSMFPMCQVLLKPA